MAKFMGFIIGGVEIAAGIALEIMLPGNPLGIYLIAGGAGAIIGNVGTLLSQPQGGLGTASRNPVMPWNIVYGRAKVGGTLVYLNSFGDTDKFLDLVFVLAAHPCMSIDALLFDNQRVKLNPANNSSYSPSQQTMSISSIVRSSGLATVTTTGVIADLQPGDRVQIHNVTDGVSNDRSLNGIVYVYEVVSSTVFTYLSGGLDTAPSSGLVTTMWPNYKAKVYCEFLNGDQTATFVGMTNGTPTDGDTGNINLPDNNPWTAQHILNGKACAFLRLHYDDAVFSSGLPQISFRLRGKKNIYDPRNDETVAVAINFANGWGNNAHEGPYEMGEDLGMNWGLNDDVTYPYNNVAAATDGNPTTYAAQGYRHVHQYAGCLWNFPTVPPSSPATPLYLSILSEVPSSGPGSLRSAGIYYSLDAGSTWTMIYDQAIRAKQWDNVALPNGQDTFQVQVMAFMDSHDDMTHYVYEIRLSTSIATTIDGYTENAVLCTADYLADTTYGFKAAYGGEIPLDWLIKHANICDESVALASGSTEPRYALNGTFNLNTSRGEILQNMLTACGGRVTYSSGQFIVWPAYWAGVTLGLGDKIPSTVRFNITTSHTYGNASDGSPAVQGIGVVTRNLDVNPETVLWIQSDDFLYRDSEWTTQTDSDVLDYDSSTGLVTIPDAGAYSGGSRVSTLRDIVATIYTADTLFQDNTPGLGDKMNVYDCWLDLTYPDGSTAVMRPTQWSIIPQSTGSVSSADLAVDDDAATCATIERWHSSSLGAPPGLQITNFVMVSAAGPPDLGLPGIAGSREILGITAGPFVWKPKLPIRELYNGCKGMFISPANGWQNADFPPYAQDADHGYSGPANFEGDQNLADDGGDRRWLEIQLPFTISPFAAQRLAKIELMRKRQQGMGTFSFNMSLYKLTVLDIVALTLPLLGWTGKLLEVGAHRLVFNRAEGGPTLGCELDLQETDPSVYEWSVTEQLAAQGPGLGVLPITSNTSAPASATAVSNASTSVIGADGVARSQILVTWPAASDAFVTNGGHIEINYQNASSPSGPWMSAPPVSGDATQTYIGGVTDGATYNVEVRYVNTAGAPSDWTATAPVTVSGAASALPPSSITGSGASTGNVLTWNGSAWVPAPPTGGSGGGSGTTGLVIGFVVASGSAGVNVAAMLPAASAGSVSKCVVVTKASDATTALTFVIKKNGASVFATTIAAGTASGTVSTFTAPVTVAASDVFTLDITSGSTAWQFTAQLE